MKNFNENNIVYKKIKYIGIINLIVIIVFIIAVIYFIFSGFKFIFNKNNDVNIYYDYNEIYNDEYSNYEKNNIILVKDNMYFCNIEDIINTIVGKMQFKDNQELINVFSKEMKDNYKFSNDEYLLKLETFFDNFLMENNGDYSMLLKEVYNIENSNYYICYLKNYAGEVRRIVLNIDFSNSNYEITDIEF